MAAGLVLCIDFKHHKTHHYAKVFNTALWKFLLFSERNFPFKPKHVLILNCHPLIEKGVQISKSFLSEKIANRVRRFHFRGDKVFHVCNFRFKSSTRTKTCRSICHWSLYLRIMTVMQNLWQNSQKIGSKR